VFGVSADGRFLVYAPAPRRARLVWLDRDGRELGRLGEPARLGSFHLAPDGRRVAVEFWNEDTGGRDLWSVDVVSGVANRLTFDPIDAFAGIWSPDGRRLAYSRPNPGPPDLAVHSLEGGDTRIVLSAPGVQVAGHWSPDGNEIAYVDFVPERREQRQLWLASLDGLTRRFRQTPANQEDPRFSPDGRRLAYVSDESGRPEVYVAPLRGTGQPRRLSREGGVMPRWRGNGQELFFLQPDGLMLSVDPGTEEATPRALFHVARAPAGTMASGGLRESYYDITSDGQRFLVSVPEGPQGQAGLRVAIDWAPPR
jgi:Tol biopolymer transport system component